MDANNKIDDGGSAFPSPPVGTGDPRDGMAGGSSGMTLREYYAGLAMQGILADTGRGGTFEDYAKDAVKFADALIKELRNTQATKG